MDELETVRNVLLGFFIGFMFALALVCMYQYLTDQFGSTPLREIRAALT